MNGRPKILTVLGTRPEGIKLAPVIRELASRPHQFQSIVCSTSQHREMLRQVLEVFDIRPDIDLDVMQPNQSLAGLTSVLFSALDRVAGDIAPDWILAQGDTTTVLVASIVAFYRRIPFAHVEAGLRTGDLARPFPEEMNRRVADLVATAYFAPTAHAREALLAEGVDPRRVFVTGNTVVDAVQTAAGLVNGHPGPLAARSKGGPLVLITTHRRESFGDVMRQMLLGLRELSEALESKQVTFVMPVHMNPLVRGPTYELLGGRSNVILTEPLDYLSLVSVLKHAALVLTDSGGLQEEAPSLGVPVMVMRDATERPEGIAAGVARLVGTRREQIVADVCRFFHEPEFAASFRRAVNPYGDGQAARRIADVLLELSARWER